ncbi:MAG: ROK family transcriptional regulator [Candidatus Ratteibacteria bacterium]
MKKNIKTANRKFMREWNRKLVLQQIRSSGETSQIKLVKKTKLSAGTIVNITKELYKENFIRYTKKGASLRGRKPENFTLNPNARYVISVALFALETRIAIINLNEEILHKIAYPTKSRQGAKAVLKILAARVEKLLQQHSIPKNKVHSIAIAMEGSVDAEEGTLKISSHFGWNNVPVKDILATLLGLKTFVESENRAMAIGEYWFGAGKNTNSMLCVDIDSGIGAAFIKNGEVHHGAHNLEAELGHSLVFTNGEICRCGRKGCLEVVSSGSAMIKKVASSMTSERAKKYGITKKLSSFSEREAMRIIFQMAQQDDTVAKMVLKEAGYYLGLSIANMITYIDPEIIVLAGYVAEEDPGILLNFIQETYNQKVFLPDLRKTQIVKSILGENSVLIGGAEISYRDIFE